MKKILVTKGFLVITCGVIAVAMLVSLIFAIKEGSKEKIIGSAIVLGLSLIAVLLFFIYQKN